jgi:hypothetical protein
MSRVPSVPPHEGRSPAPPRARPTGGRAAVAWLAGAALLAVPVRGVAQGTQANQQKADMVCNMAKFVQWPDAVVAQNRGQLVVTILGEDDLAVALASTLSARQVNGKPVFVRDARGSQIVYIAASESTHTASILSELAGSPVLTFADRPGFTDEGGMMSFSGAAPRMHFDVALQRAERAGLRISSRLLALSRIVDEGRGAER